MKLITGIAHILKILIAKFNISNNSIFVYLISNFNKTLI